MAYQVIMTTMATNDLNDAVEHIATELSNPTAAEALTQEVYDNIQNISEFPRIGRKFEAFFTPRPLRWILASSYMVFYTIVEENESVEILRIVYSKRDLESVFGGMQ